MARRLVAGFRAMYVNVFALKYIPVENCVIFYDSRHRNEDECAGCLFDKRSIDSDLANTINVESFVFAGYGYATQELYTGQAGYGRT